MATESLVVELDANTKKLQDKLKATEKDLEDLKKETDKTGASFSKFKSVAGSVAGGLAKLATVTIAVGAAITAMTLSSASNRRELEQLSRQAKTTAEDFQALAFATTTYGINAEQIADISKDVSDKVGEFSAAGTGAFQDYADVMKLTKKEARSVAIEFQNLSSQEVIGQMVANMESVNTTGDQMTFVLESMGSDLSMLKPLFAGNSEELNKLKDRFRAVNDELQITEGQANQLKAVSSTYSLLTTQIGNATTEISASLAPAMDEFFNDVISVVPQATQVLINFINTFRTPEEIKSLKDINEQLDMSKEKLEKLSPVAERVGKLREDNAATLNVLSTTGERLAEKEFEIELKRFNLLKKQQFALEENIELKKIADAETFKGGSIDVTGTGTGDELQAIADRFKSEEDLLTEKLERELEIIGDNNALKLELEEEYLMNIVDLDQRAEDAKTNNADDALGKQAILREKSAKAQIALEDSVAKNAVSLSRMILGDSKAAALIALAVQKSQALSANTVATAAGSQLAFAAQQVPGDPTSFARGTVAAANVKTMGAINAGLIIATGLGEASAISGGGGGGGLGGGGGGSFGNDAPATQESFQQETSSLELTDASSSGGTTLVLQAADGDELGQAIANWISKATQEGRI